MLKVKIRLEPQDNFKNWNMFRVHTPNRPMDKSPNDYIYRSAKIEGSSRDTTFEFNIITAKHPTGEVECMFKQGGLKRLLSKRSDAVMTLPLHTAIGKTGEQKLTFFLAKEGMMQRLHWTGSNFERTPQMMDALYVYLSVDEQVWDLPRPIMERKNLGFCCEPPAKLLWTEEVRMKYLMVKIDTLVTIQGITSISELPKVDDHAIDVRDFRDTDIASPHGTTLIIPFFRVDKMPEDKGKVELHYRLTTRRTWSGYNFIGEPIQRFCYRQQSEEISVIPFDFNFTPASPQTWINASMGVLMHGNEEPILIPIPETHISSRYKQKNKHGDRTESASLREFCWGLITRLGMVRA